MDVLNLRETVLALAGVDAVVYLIHGLGDADFRHTDREAAENLRDAVDHQGVRRLVYFSGLIPDVSAADLSEHLASRLEVEETLAQSTASTLTLRAAMVVGSGSTSFEMVRQISERLPLLQTIPTWMRDTVVQPIAVADAVHYLAEAVERVDVTGHLDVAGPDRLTYPELLDLYADIAGLTRIQVTVPGLPEEARGVGGRLTDVDTPTVQSLMASLRARHGRRPRAGHGPGSARPDAVEREHSAGPCRERRRPRRCGRRRGPGPRLGGGPGLSSPSSRRLERRPRARPRTS